MTQVGHRMMSKKDCNDWVALQKLLETIKYVEFFKDSKHPVDVHSNRSIQSSWFRGFQNKYRLLNSNRFTSSKYSVVLNLLLLFHRTGTIVNRMDQIFKTQRCV